MSKHEESIKIFLALVGSGYLLFLLASLVSLIGTVSKPTTYDWWNVIDVSLLIISSHVSINWIKRLFSND